MLSATRHLISPFFGVMWTCLVMGFIQADVEDWLAANSLIIFDYTSYYVGGLTEMWARNENGENPIVILE